MTAESKPTAICVCPIMALEAPEPRWGDVVGAVGVLEAKEGTVGAMPGEGVGLTALSSSCRRGGLGHGHLRLHRGHRLYDHLVIHRVPHPCVPRPHRGHCHGHDSHGGHGHDGGCRGCHGYCFYCRLRRPHHHRRHRLRCRGPCGATLWLVFALLLLMVVASVLSLTCEGNRR